MKQSKGMNTRAKQENFFCFAVVILFIIQWLVFWVYANINSILLAFKEFDVITESHVWLPREELFQNFSNFLKDIFSETGSSYLLNGVVMHFLSAVVCLPISYMVAFIIYKKLPGAEFFKIVLYIPAIISSMVIVLLYQHFIEGFLDGVWLNWFNRAFPKVFINPQFNWWVIIFYICFFGTPGSLLINLGSMSRVPPDLVEYGELEGISLFKEFCLITVPMVFPVLQVQCLGLFIGFFTTQGPLYTLYGGEAPENLQTFGYFIFTSIYQGRGGVRPELMYGYNSASNLLIGLVSIPIVQATKWLLDKLDPEAEF